MKRIPLLIFLLGVALSTFIAPATLKAADAQTNFNSEITFLRGEVERLKAENAALRKENTSLRRALAAKPQAATNSVVAAPAAPAAVAPGQQQTGYWLTISSGIRHNSSCRYYMNSKGRSCGPNEGRACKLCGG
jgi:hypothetical protein